MWRELASTDHVRPLAIGAETSFRAEHRAAGGIHRALLGPCPAFTQQTSKADQDMAESTKLVARPRTELGTIKCRKLRKQGFVPGNVYGHGTDSIAFAVDGEALHTIVNAGRRVVDLELDGETGKAMFREVQWNTWGTLIQHIDLIRVSADERVTVEVPIVLRGTSPGVQAGGNMDQSLRSISVDCLAVELPESIVVRIGSLEIGDSIHISDLEVPENTTIMNDPETLVVQVVEAVELDDEADDEVPGPAEPEVIGQKKDEDEDE